jgi:hypothetical protein
MMFKVPRWKNERYEILNRPSTTIIYGMIGSGKSALGFKLMERAHQEHPEKEFLVLTYDNTAKKKLEKLLPAWMGTTEENRLDRLPKGIWFLEDEAWRIANSKRRPGKDEALKQASELALVRQRDQHQLVLVQSLAILDVDYFRFGANLIMRHCSVESILTERPDLVKIIIARWGGFNFLRKYKGIDLLRLFHIQTPHSGDYVELKDSNLGFYQTGLPTFWKEEISTIWSDVICQPTEKN